MAEQLDDAAVWNDPDADVIQQSDGDLVVYDSTAGFVVIRQRIERTGLGWLEQMVFVRPENAEELSRQLLFVAGLMRK